MGIEQLIHVFFSSTWSPIKPIAIFTEFMSIFFHKLKKTDHLYYVKKGIIYSTP